MPATNAVKVRALAQEFISGQVARGERGWEQARAETYDRRSFATPDAIDWLQTQLLEQVSLAYRNEFYIASEILPEIRVTAYKGDIREYSRDDWNRVQADVRGENSRGPRGGFGVTEQGYECVEYSMSADVTDKDRRSASGGDDPDEATTEWCTDQNLLLQEWLTAQVVFPASGATSYATGNYQTLATTNRWSDAAADILGQFIAARAIAEPKFGRTLNTLVLGINTSRYMRNHPQFASYNAAGVRVQASLQQVMDLVEVERILIGRATRTTSQEGAAADTYTNIWGDHAALVYTPPTPGLLTPTFGYTLVDEAVDHLVDGWRNGDGATSDAIRVRHSIDIKVLANFGGYLWINAGDAS